MTDEKNNIKSIIDSHKEFAQAIGFITELLRDVMSENRQLSVDIAAIRGQIDNIREHITSLDRVVHGNGRDPILVRLEALEQTAQQIEANLEKDNERFHEELNGLQNQISKHLEEIRQAEERKEEREKDLEEGRILVDRAGKWRILTMILTFLLGVLASWVTFTNTHEKTKSTPSISEIKEHIIDAEHQHQIDKKGHIIDVPLKD